MISEIYYSIQEDLTNNEIDKLTLLFNQIMNTLPNHLDNCFILKEDKLFCISDIKDIGQDFYLNTNKGSYLMNHMLQPYSFIIKVFLISAAKLCDKIILLGLKKYEEEQLYSYFINKKIA